ncbi:hypothetical protein [Streptomyces luteocolor]|nr:hypothetical protein [Streptomyces luteocolor]
MSIHVRAPAHCPLTSAAVAELVTLPSEPEVPDGDDDFDLVDAALRERG